MTVSRHTEEFKPEEIRALRKRMDCTQEEFAKILGVTAVALSRWETGKSCPQGRKTDLLEYLSQKLEEEKLPPEQLKRILLVGGAVLHAGVSPLALLQSGLLTEENLVLALKTQFEVARETGEKRGEDTDV